MSLDVWRDQRLVVEHEASPQEISDLLGIVTTDLNDARIPALSPDRRLACCYQAILTAARAALRSAGYRVPKGAPNHHYYAIQSLQFTAGLDSPTLRKIESIGKKRVMADYTRVGEVSPSMVEDTLALADTCCREVRAWIRQTHPRLLPN